MRNHCGQFWFGLAVVTATIFAVQPAVAQTVDVELLLLADVSGSINTAEFELQRDGYAAAFQSAAVQTQIANNPNGIAVALGYWSNFGEQVMVVDWTHITNAAEANAFAAAIAGTTRQFNNNTGVQDALRWGTGELSGNSFTGAKSVIDISGDGPCNSPGSGSNACQVAWGRDYALNNGVDTINGLVIQTTVGGSLYNYYNDEVIGGTGAFLNVANDFADFSRAVETKIFREIGGEVPEPSFYLTLGIGLYGLFWQRRRMKGQQPDTNC